jgi:hypothetical protein
MRKGFSLVELFVRFRRASLGNSLIVIGVGVIVILIAALVPCIMHVREAVTKFGGEGEVAVKDGMIVMPMLSFSGVLKEIVPAGRDGLAGRFGAAAGRDGLVLIRMEDGRVIILNACYHGPFVFHEGKYSRIEYSDTSYCITKVVVKDE